jgi:pyruvate,water dikinase
MTGAQRGAQGLRGVTIADTRGMEKTPRFVRSLSEFRARDVALVGGKNASLGELIASLAPLGVEVPPGFAITAEAYRYFLRERGLGDKVRGILGELRADAVVATTRRVIEVEARLAKGL